MIKTKEKKLTVFFLICSLIFSTLLTSGCGKNDVVKIIHQNDVNDTESFCQQFFTKYNFPYQKIYQKNVQNTPEEYLFYIKDGIVYRTINDYYVIIVNRNSLSESDEKKKQDYSGELYRIFEEDEYDLLMITAYKDYAILNLPSAIPDYLNSELIQSFIEFASKYPSA